MFNRMNQKEAIGRDPDSWSDTTRQTSHQVQEGEEKRQPESIVNVITSAPTSGGNGKLSLWQAFKLYPRVVGYCFGLSSAILLYGYDLVVVGAVSALPQFQRNFGEVLNGKLIIGSLWLAIWGVASPFGALIGAGVGGILQDKTGRKWSLLIAGIISAVAVALCYVCDTPATFDGRRAFFTLAKFLQGIAIGQIMVTVQTYMSEILPPKLRGPILTFFPIFTLLGQLLGAVVLNSQIRRPGPQAYRICFASQWAISIILIAVCFFLPESPTWLIRKNRMSDALKAQTQLNKPDMDSEASVEQLRISIAAEEETAGAQTYLDCLKGTNLRRTSIVGFANMLPMLFGLVLLSKASYFLQVVGMKPSDSTLFLIIGITVGLVANIGSIWTLNAFGRRPLIIIGMAILSLLWLGMGISGIFTGSFTVYWIAGSMMATIFVAGLSCWPASYAVASETSSLQLRAKTTGIGWIVNTLLNCTFTVVLPYIYNPGKHSGNLRGKTCFVFAGCCVIACTGAWYYIPEMKERSATDIDHMFAQRLPTRSFKRWNSGEAEAVRSSIASTEAEL